MNGRATVDNTLSTLRRATFVFLKVGLALGLFVAVFVGLFAVPVVMMAAFLVVYFVWLRVRRGFRS